MGKPWAVGYPAIHVHSHMIFNRADIDFFLASTPPENSICEKYNEIASCSASDGGSGIVSGKNGGLWKDSIALAY